MNSGWIYLAALALGAGFGVPVAVLSAALGQGRGGAVVLQVFAFLVLIWAMRKYLFGPISGVLEARQNEVQSTLDQVYRDRQAMEASRQEYETRLATIESEARDRIQAAIKEAQGM